MSMLSPQGTVRPEVPEAVAIAPATEASPADAHRIAIRNRITRLLQTRGAAGSGSAAAPTPRAELRQPRESPDPQPERRQQHVEEDEGKAENAPPDGPAPPGH